MDAIAPVHGAEGVLAGLPQRLQSLMAQRGAHPARTVVLVPYAQLMPLARKLWAGHAPDGFAPRFETTMNWAARGGFAPGPLDLGFDRGLDLLTARAWLDRAGLGRHAGVLAPKLVEVGRHINLEVITCTELESLAGESGNFQTVLKNQLKTLQKQPLIH